MERVDHIHVGQVRRSRLIGQIHRMLERQIPDGERLILGISRAPAALVLVIELAQARRHLARARAGRGNDTDGARRLDIIVLSVAFVRDDQADIRRIVLDHIVLVHGHAHIAQLLFKQIRRVLAAVLRDDHAADIQPDGAEGVDQAHDVEVVGDAEVPPALVHLDVRGVDGDNDLCLLFQLQKHPHLAVGQKARQYPRGVVVVEKLAAKLQIELAAERLDTLENPLGLQLQIFFVVKSLSYHTLSSLVLFLKSI